ncbi:LysR family transcriptional regulator [Photobacterium swingsii]|uniref:LysR family transcriptional regulator n=1 Tax=Photobacterium swingsii TaxID=680026 RepID=UPI003D0AA553
MLLEDLKIILKVAEFRSITAAAANLDMRTATASAAVKRVENALGLELFIRTTRHLRLSSAGERYIPQCEQALLMLDQAKQNMKDGLDIVDGELRIALSSDLGRNLVQPWLDEFMDAYPQLSVRANISDSNVDFYRDSVDMALRYGSPTDANMYGFKVCDVPRVLCATKAYLAQHGTPSVPSDLTQHNALLYQLHDVIQDVWEFSADGVKHKVKLTGNRASNDGDMVRRWCIAGHGLAVKSSLDMSQDLLSGSVESVMPAFKATPTELWLVCPSRQSITPAVRLLRDAFREKTAVILEQLADKGVI